jgi:hypothetical protein
LHWTQLIDKVCVETERNTDMAEVEPDKPAGNGELASFLL